MSTAAFKDAIARDLPTLFVNIGWTIHYNGSEDVLGQHTFIKQHPGKTVSESRAFIADGGYFRCGIGNGRTASGPMHAVFVARDPGDQVLKVVGVYAAADISFEGETWAIARTRLAIRIPLEKRPPVHGWRGNKGMRRWATRSDKREPEHRELLAQFRSLIKQLSSAAGLPDNFRGAGRG